VESFRQSIPMRIGESLRQHRPHFSFEFYPPKSDEAVESLLDVVRTLRALEPGFVSVTYGAGGSTRARTLTVAKRIKHELGIEVMAHVTCVGNDVTELRSVFAEIEAARIENVLALRGDPPRGQDKFTVTKGGLEHASDLISLLKREFHFCIGAAAYPEKHPEAPDPETDLLHLVCKVEAGAEFLVSQLFFQNDAYFHFVERMREAGITVPIVPGIMPITNFSQVARMTAMCGATIPPRLLRALEARADEPEAVAELGVAYATLQCAELLDRGAPGIHFYTLNRSPATRAVVSALLASRDSSGPNLGATPTAVATFARNDAEDPRILDGRQ
jgi:methylenetetrahydrofolate reductase (NADPH)